MFWALNGIMHLHRNKFLYVPPQTFFGSAFIPEIVVADTKAEALKKIKEARELPRPQTTDNGFFRKRYKFPETLPKKIEA